MRPEDLAVSDDDTRYRWEAFRDRVARNAIAAKSAEDIVPELSRAYAALSPQERATVDRVIAQWTTSADESKRFEALALIREHRIVAALAAVDELVQRLAKSTEPGAPYELAKIRRLKELFGTAETK